MLYTVASWNWAPGDPLTPAMARGGLNRWRPKSEEIAGGGPALAVALRYDETRGQVVAEGVTARGSCGPWSAPAIVDSVGGVMVLAAIPAALVRVIGTAEIRVHGEAVPAVPRAHLTIGPSASKGRVRVVDGRPLSQKQAQLCSPSTATSRSGPAHAAGGGTPRLRGMAQPESGGPALNESGTPSAFQSEVNVHRDSRPPPGFAKGDRLRLRRVFPSLWKWQEDEGS
ncbi:hypothetical protein Sinac_5372 [Singulisphaera acidiphila DSM 18658]|uniref:Uncharacterized protein n=1 Tax=Singulisphaera acidiphila (strain ATCC BAA-1392 / DSM 18658 / VKM B-2454 / MOB10) TaxID=886293 RepID=L0DL15_SINAD|nr:hypothetical protein Sinac_5372 [Singulisphaera acidiphila DSM 18658]